MFNYIFQLHSSTGIAIVWIFIIKSQTMIATSISICRECIHLTYCVLTDQKEKVWTCSEYNDAEFDQELIVPGIEELITKPIVNKITKQ